MAEGFSSTGNKTTYNGADLSTSTVPNATLTPTSSAPPGQVSYDSAAVAYRQSITGGAVQSGAVASGVATYEGESGGRLLEVTPPDADDDDKRIAYIQLIAPDGAFVKDFPQDMKEDRAIMESLMGELKNKYQKFIVTAIGISSQERTQIMPTFGDAFAATITGKDPTVLSISGNLIFDYAGSGKLSWYAAFLNSYEYFLRGSRLAKWRAKLKLVIPDLVEYTGYMTSLSTQSSSDTDTVVAMQFSYLVTSQTIFKSTVEVQGSNAQRNTTNPTGTLPNTTAQTPIGMDTIGTSLPGVMPTLDAQVPKMFQTALTGALGSVLRQVPVLNTALTALGKVNLMQKVIPTAVNGSAVSPMAVLEADQVNNAGRALETLVNDNVMNLGREVTAATSLLKPKLEELISQANGEVLKGRFDAVIQRNIAGLMGSVSVAPSNLVKATSASASNVALVPAGERYRKGGSLW